jgi:hypothetical protein
MSALASLSYTCAACSVQAADNAVEYEFDFMFGSMRDFDLTLKLKIRSGVSHNPKVKAKDFC